MTPPISRPDQRVGDPVLEIVPASTAMTAEDRGHDGDHDGNPEVHGLNGVVGRQTREPPAATVRPRPSPDPDLDQMASPWRSGPADGQHDLLAAGLPWSAAASRTSTADTMGCRRIIVIAATAPASDEHFAHGVRCCASPRNHRPPNRWPSTAPPGRPPHRWTARSGAGDDRDRSAWGPMSMPRPSSGRCPRPGVSARARLRPRPPRAANTHHAGVPPSASGSSSPEQALQLVLDVR